MDLNNTLMLAAAREHHKKVGITESNRHQVTQNQYNRLNLQTCKLLYLRRC